AGPRDRGPSLRGAPAGWHRDKGLWPWLSTSPARRRRAVFAFAIGLRGMCNRGIDNGISLVGPIRCDRGFRVQAAKTLDRPLGFDAGLRWHQLLFGAPPLGLDGMATVAIHTLLGKFGRGKSGVFRKFELGSQFAFDARVNRGF